jgi:hypothetical protein
MKKITILLLCPFLTAIFHGCDDFIEKDLEGKNITILAPMDKLVTSNTSITFWWETIEGTLDYNVQVVSPAFDKVEKLWADTFVTGNKFEISLVPGSYQWRIKGWNGSSQTNFTTASFVIDSTLNITSETIVLRFPPDNTYSNSLSQTFRWDKLYNADEYRFRITNSSHTLLKDEVIQSSESSFEFTADGDYSWRVRGQNEISNTLYSSFTITIDTQKPGAPSLKSPSNGSSLAADSIRFEWTRMNDNGSPLYDSLYVFRDSDLKENVISEKTDKTFYEYLLEPGTYYWYVKTCDVAGNISKESSTFRFIKNY